MTNKTDTQVKLSAEFEAKANQSTAEFSLRQLVSTQKSLWFLAWGLGVATALSVLGLTMLAGWFLSMAAVAGVVAVGAHLFNYMLPAGVIRSFAIVRTLSRYGDLLVSHQAVFGLLKDLRVRFFRHWAGLPIISRRTLGVSSSQQMHRLVKDIDTLDELPLRLISPVVVAAVAFLAVAGLVVYWLPSALWAMVIVAMAFVIAALTMRAGVRVADTQAKHAEARKSRFVDVLPALTQLLTWQRWGEQTQHIKSLDLLHRQSNESAHALRRKSLFIMQVCMALGAVLLLWVAGKFFEGRFAAGEISAFTLQNLNDYAAINPALVLALVFGVLSLGEVLAALVAEPLAFGRAKAAKSRINELLTSANAPTPTVKITDLSAQNAGKLTLNLDNVSVKIPQAVLGASGIHMSAGCDKPTLLVGKSGAGKSTLLATLAQELAAVSGKITLNGTDYQNVDFGRELGFLGQNVDIFDQTLADNLRLGKPSASDDELWAVLEKVNLYAWAKAQPKGLATPLGEYGMAVSGGQARRIALARLLLDKKAILLLDEPFAGLDTHTRQIVWQHLCTMQQSGDIGILIIATHAVWQEASDVNVVAVG
ncbi:cysteine ABC transporter [Moraxella caviae]|uniref:Beta-(1-->2)glucan export ATP-binding/permease protein NdvA n=1 Tax=Moraxella caviae TaxID=34060 RepID=A0A1S9ZSC0_9GAMM|nr:ATP-binding cassette domain-containing protein [Moraxella caviae]OOR86303.1 cysteine ABC transporter [Moraxella caviae]STZ14610.1 Beta-(1-->2)glucan export ATP-binding/permease protein NdvA [Moraxella caviae]VEW11379.1 Beta-(1-->2)glucan export ATP-binding/permease protein NdvA [Moraxella caviae]